MYAYSHNPFPAPTDGVQKKVGVLSKETATGPFVDDWRQVFGEAAKDLEEFEISTALSSAAFSTKDEAELVRHTDWVTRC